VKQAAGHAGRIHVLRLQPGEDVRLTLQAWAMDNRIEAAAITSAVGSLTHAHLRYANRAEGVFTPLDLEVLSLSGTLGIHGLHPPSEHR